MRTRWLILLTLTATALTACSEEDTPGAASSALDGGVIPPCTDGDGDGFGLGCAAGLDCDDADPSSTNECRNCASPETGCACDGSVLEETCYLDPVDVGGRSMCHSGTRFCRDGAWTSCLQLERYELSGNLAGAASAALVTGPVPCNPCNPSCYSTTDTPGPSDVTTGGTGVVYTATPGGVTLPMGGTTTGTLPDADGDGVPDLYDSAPTNPAITGFEGGFFHVLPYGGAAVDPLYLMVRVRTADVYFLMDTTGSMGGEIDNLKATLNTTIIPSIRTTIPDAWFGVGRHDDYPVNGYGAEYYCDPWGCAYIGDTVYQNLANITDTATGGGATTVTNAVNALYTRWGNDLPESQIPALYAIATGSALGPYLPGSTCAGSRFGYPCFRPGTVPIIILFTDAPFHNGPPVTGTATTGFATGTATNGAALEMGTATPDPRVNGTASASASVTGTASLDPREPGTATPAPRTSGTATASRETGTATNYARTTGTATNQVPLTGTPTAFPGTAGTATASVTTGTATNYPRISGLATAEPVVNGTATLYARTTGTADNARVTGTATQYVRTTGTATNQVPLTGTPTAFPGTAGTATASVTTGTATNYPRISGLATTEPVVNGTATQYARTTGTADNARVTGTATQYVRTTGTATNQVPLTGTPTAFPGTAGTATASVTTGTATNYPRISGLATAEPIVTGTATQYARTTGTADSPRVTGTATQYVRTTSLASNQPVVTGTPSPYPATLGTASNSVTTGTAVASPRITGIASNEPRVTGTPTAYPRTFGTATNSIHTGTASAYPRTTSTASNYRETGTATAYPLTTSTASNLVPVVTGTATLAVVTGTATARSTFVRNGLNDTSPDWAWTTNQFVGDVIQVFAGTGRGENRVISSHADRSFTMSSNWRNRPTTGSFYRVVPKAADDNLYDLAKVWTTNQFVGYTVTITSGTGIGQTRLITANNVKSLTVSPAWTTTPSTTSGYAIYPNNTLNDTTPSWSGTITGARVRIRSGTGAGQESTVTANTATQLTVSPAWTTPPNATSVYEVIAASELNKLYDTTKTWAVNQFTTFTYVVRITGGRGSGQSATVTANSANVLTVSPAWPILPDTTSTYEIAEALFNDKLYDLTPSWTGSVGGARVRILSGTGAGQERNITASAATRLTVSLAWTTLPDATSVYEVIAAADLNKLYDTTRSWTLNQFMGFTVTITGGRGAGQFAAVSSNTATVLTVAAAWATLPDATSTYDIREAAFNTRLYDTTTPGWTGTVTGSTVFITSGTGAGQNRVISSNTPTVLNVTPAWVTQPDATSNYEVVAAADVVRLYDTTKSWVVNQFMTGYVVNILSGAGVGQIRAISSNTANVLTVSACVGRRCPTTRAPTRSARRSATTNSTTPRRAGRRRTCSRVGRSS